MPVLSSMDARYFLKTNYTVDNLNKLLNIFLPIAADNILTDIRTIETYEKFIDLFDKEYKKISNLLEIKIPDIKMFEDNNYYQTLYEIIQTQTKQKYNKPITVKNIYDAFQVFLSNEKFAIFVSSLSYSVIVVKKSLTEDEEMMIKFISMILIASGHILILCVSHNYSPNDYDGIFSSPLFSECHLFRNNEKDFSLNNLNLEDHSYYYIYLSTSLNESAEIENSDIHKKTPYIQLYRISQDFDKAFGENFEKLFEETKEEFPQMDKFEINKIVVTLYNCQLFELNDLQNCWTPYNVSQYSRCFIYANEFMEWTIQRVKCFNSLSETKPLFFIDFNEMHYLKIDHHFKNPFYLIGLNDSTIDLINNVYDNIPNSTKFTNRLKIKRSNSEKFVEEKLLYAFHKIWRHCKSNGKPIQAYPNQIYAVFSAINYINQYVVNKEKNENLENDESKNHKGCIFQVKTGEGKSIIIRALAEIFAKMGKKVHIVTSNIILACRDYENSYDYLKKCNFKTSVLLHKGEFDDIKCNNKDYFYPSKNEKDFFHDSWFDETTEMNTKILESSKFKKSCDIVFSTFFNFEAWYLRNSEIHPRSASQYFKDCYLIIDEADTILIDELLNGTVIAKDIKSNGIEVLEKIYDMVEGREIDEHLLSEILDELMNGQKMYSIRKHDILSIINDIKKAKHHELDSDYVIKFDKKGIGRIIPFDKEQKGIIEREKEFSGFVHQFIGIKERRRCKNSNIEIRPLSMNYKFISHPLFVRMYQGVWGFTGTIGTDEDKQILRKYYNIDTICIPLHSPNYRKDLPPVICDLNNRDKIIIDEIKSFHQRKIPVLVICKDISELNELKYKILLTNDYESSLLVFDGTDLDKSEIESKSGQKGMITLGTNFCGRGVDIDYNNEYPLHVIVSYGPRHTRALYQAYGRTGRNGKIGSTRIISSKEDYKYIKALFLDGLITRSLNEYDYKLSKQFEYFNSISSKCHWIFDSIELLPDNEKFDDHDILELRKSFINVNRIIATSCNYPLIMDVKTFHDIQFQKIYSLKNCPECIYTWILFQRYINELIVQTWSIFIDQTTKEFYFDDRSNEQNSEGKNDFQSFFNNKAEIVMRMMDSYFQYRQSTIKQIFMNIHKKVTKNQHILNVYKSLPEEISEYRYESTPSSFFFFKAGFYPYEIKDKSGSRVCFLDGSDDDDDTEQEQIESDQSVVKMIKTKIKKDKMKEINFIEDPELNYIRKDGDGFSITCVIDKIFEKICKTIDEKLSNYFGLHFFIRRCFAGCEFGICIDPLFDEIEKNPYCLADANPLFLLTIQCKSTKPILASMLLIVLVFTAIIATKIAKYLASPGTSITDLLKSLGKKLWKTVKSKCKDIVISMIDKYSPLKIYLEKIIEWLKKQILDLLHNEHDKIALLMRMALSIFGNRAYDSASEKLDSEIKINSKVKGLFSDLSPMADLIKIGILFILLITALIKSFKARRALKQTAGVYQNEYENSQDHFHKNAELEDYKSYKEIKDDINSRQRFEDIK